MALLNASQIVAEYPVLTARRLKALRAARQIPFHRLGWRTVLYKRDDVVRYLNSCRVEAYR